MLRTVLFALAVFLSGCFTCIGAGLGAATPRYVEVAYAPLGETVRADTSDGDVVEGEVTASDLHEVVLERDGHAYKLPLDRIRAMMERKTHVGTGAAIGLVMDLLCLVGGAVAIGVAFSNFHGFGYQF
jgi:hypothetical protein